MISAGDCFFVATAAAGETAAAGLAVAPDDRKELNIGGVSRPRVLALVYASAASFELSARAAIWAS